MLGDLKKLRTLSWGYRRRSTTVAVAVVSAVCGVAAQRMLPTRVLPGPPSAALAGLGAYAALRLGTASGLTKRFKHEWLDRFGGDVDDAQTWLLGTLAGLAVLGSVRSAGDVVRRSAEARAGRSAVR